MPGMSPIPAALLLLGAAGPAAGPSIQIYGTGQYVPPGIENYFSAADYPADALDAHAQGTVRFHIVTGDNGRVTDCTVVVSSGNASLDRTTCALAQQRFRFVPTHDEYGLPVGISQDFIAVWRLP